MKKKNTTFNFIYTNLKGHPFYIVMMIFGTIIYAADLSLKPYIIKMILDALGNSVAENTFKVTLVPVAYYFILLVTCIISYRTFDYFIEVRFFPQLKQDLILYVSSLLLQHKITFFQTEASGKVANQVNDIADNVPRIIEMFCRSFISTCLSLFVSLYLLYHTHVVFFVILSLWIIANVVLTYFVAPRLHKTSSHAALQISLISATLVDIISNIFLVKTFFNSNQEKKVIRNVTNNAKRADRRFHLMYMVIWLVYGLLFLLVQAFSVYFLLYYRQKSMISIGDFGLIISTNMTIITLLATLMKEASNYFKYAGKIQKALDTIVDSIDESAIQSESKKKISISQGEILFKDITFLYPQSSEFGKVHPVYKKFNLLIKGGTKIGFVGYSGCGKTTLIKLLLRIYDVQSGDITIDGQSIYESSYESLCQSIGLISQEPLLFQRSIEDNILYGKLDASQEDVISAAQKAHIHNFINRLPDGYKTKIREGGSQFSGGQKQRISIARFILKNAPILILDEATSQLDSHNEKMIQDTLEQIMKDRTTIVIAHRLSTLLKMDRIIVLDEGKVVQDGTHQELVKEKNGLYQKLWLNQTTM